MVAYLCPSKTPNCALPIQGIFQEGKQHALLRNIVQHCATCLWSWAVHILFASTLTAYRILGSKAKCFR